MCVHIFILIFFVVNFILFYFIFLIEDMRTKKALSAWIPLHVGIRIL